MNRLKFPTINPGFNIARPRSHPDSIDHHLHSAHPTAVDLVIALHLMPFLIENPAAALWCATSVSVFKTAEFLASENVAAARAQGPVSSCALKAAHL